MGHTDVATVAVGLLSGDNDESHELWAGGPASEGVLRFDFRHHSAFPQPRYIAR